MPFFLYVPFITVSPLLHSPRTRTVADLRRDRRDGTAAEKKGIKATPVADRGWGLVTTLELPGGDKLGLYEPKHLSPLT